ncbi:hypothetical protein EVAR_92304_1 [Eumeta japonica]|uniref:Uncharacterized protein n=1 Tax=Eumeta variegata TaxID=151549 RepID=A0A4C2A9H2_EUMVA|nr:hypothetical protein EVAR_92304_1 [Eumeta japonica]
MHVGFFLFYNKKKGIFDIALILLSIIIIIIQPLVHYWTGFPKERTDLRLLADCIQLLPATFIKSSDHLVEGRPAIRFPVRAATRESFFPNGYRFSVQCGVPYSHDFGLSIFFFKSTRLGTLLRLPTIVFKSFSDSAIAKLIDVFAIDIDAQSFPAQKLENVLQCSCKQFRRNNVSMSDALL